MFKVSITSRAERELKRLDQPVRNRIIIALSALASEPRPAGCLKVKSEENVWRIRVGDWRVGYQVDDNNSEVVVVRIAHRSDFYE
jgi:mRNA interferase RelE/StbE